MAIIALLMPGISFFIGYWARERYSREIVKSTAVGEVGMAIFVAAIIHLLMWWVLCWIDHDPFFKLRPLFHDSAAAAPAIWFAEKIADQIWLGLWYLVGTSILGFGVGYFAAWLVMFGPLRFLATHAWAYDLMREVKARGIVTAYVFTTIVENEKAIMYSGHLEEFYLDANGWFSYVVLKDCTRFYMLMDKDHPKTGDRQPLFRIEDGKSRKWEHLVIDGKSICNILFDPGVGYIDPSTGTVELDEALDRLIDEITRPSPVPESQPSASRNTSG